MRRGSLYDGAKADDRIDLLFPGDQFGGERNFEGAGDPVYIDLVIIGAVPFQGIECAFHQPVRDEAVEPAYDDCKPEALCVKLALSYHVHPLYVV